MSNRDPLLYVDDIREAIKNIKEYTTQLNATAFFQDRKSQHAVIHCLTVIGEAVKNLPDEWYARYPQLPWSAIAKTRDKLIHGYFGVDIKQVWEITQHDLETLESTMKSILEHEDAQAS